MRVTRIFYRGGIAAVAGAMLLTGTAAIAGSPVRGYGNSRIEAMRDADSKAREASRERFGQSNCITPATPDTCSRDSEGWVCTAYVANHRGSCG